MFTIAMVGAKVLYYVLYVDDILIFGTNMKVINGVKSFFF